MSERRMVGKSLMNDDSWCAYSAPYRCAYSATYRCAYSATYVNLSSVVYQLLGNLSTVALLVLRQGSHVGSGIQMCGIEQVWHLVCGMQQGISSVVCNTASHGTRHGIQHVWHLTLVCVSESSCGVCQCIQQVFLLNLAPLAGVIQLMDMSAERHDTLLPVSSLQSIETRKDRRLTH